ncbi:MAG TPA: riboflavin synthase [Nocardioidaceae bacterium]|nr:riboflavin synthase [Nocardioidaceae bacterium]
MFTGIVEQMGVVVARTEAGDGARLTIRGSLVVEDASPGDSIAVNGCCLTVVERDDTMFTADVMRESLDKTSLGRLAQGSPVNLERAVQVGDRLGGHLVQGHVDGTGTIVERQPGDRWEVVRVELPPDLVRYVAPKGSITIDGTSLTVVDVNDDPAWFTVALIPTTLEQTTLGRAAVGDPVNLEVDVLAKYVERLLTSGQCVLRSDAYNPHVADRRSGVEGRLK